MIDHLTQFGVSRVIKTKQKEKIIKQDFRIWVSVFGSSKKFLVDNCGEFIMSIFTYFVKMSIFVSLLLLLNQLGAKVKLKHTIKFCVIL